MKYLSLVVTLALASPAMGSTNLVANGSFELGDYNNLDADPRPEIMLISPEMTNVFGWQASGVNGVHWMDLGAQDTTNGVRSIDLQGLRPFGQFSSFSTIVPTVIGGQYKLEFDAFTGNIPNSAVVSAGSLQNQPFTGGGPGFQPFAALFTSYTFDFSAQSVNTSLVFRVTSSDGFGPVIDNVSVTAVPEPAAAILLVLGAIGLRLRTRKTEASEETPLRR